MSWKELALAGYERREQARGFICRISSESYRLGPKIYSVLQAENSAMTLKVHILKALKCYLASALKKWHTPDRDMRFKTKLYEC